MHISLSPQRDDRKLELRRMGETLTVNGEAFDFTALGEGEDIPASAVASDWIVGTIKRENGRLHLTIILPHGPEAPRAVTFPDPIIDPPNGLIALPKDAANE